MRDSAPYAVNGRFLTQSVTGVQRYARNIVSALDHSLTDSGGRIPILAPHSADDPSLAAMPLVKAGSIGGHLWEQIVLPNLWQGRLLNLCNTGPAAKADQVICIHDANVFAASGSYSFGFRAAYTALHRALVQRAARVVTVSAYSARQIARHLPVDVCNIAVLPNGHEHALKWDPSLSAVGPSLLAQSHRPGRRFVLALGSRARHKNLRLVLEIAPRLAEKGIDVIIAGGGSGIFATETLPKVPNVETIGYVTDHDLAYLMDHALCLLFPSWTEGFGLPIVEAMARGCPVISSDRASMPEVCGQAALLAPPDNPEVWVRHIFALQASSDLRDSLIGRGLERARMFSWTNSAAGYSDLMIEPNSCVRARGAGDAPLANVAVVVATLGRPEVVTATLRHLLKTQTHKPSSVIVSCTSASDAGDAGRMPEVSVVIGPAGLAAQRNAALAALPPDVEIVAFFDDDFVADPSWIAAAAQAFRDDPDIVGFTGDILADGIKGPGLSFEEAVRIVQSASAISRRSRVEPYSPYGCNMAFRFSAIGPLRFDERLVLYGWLEDRDFGGGLAKHGGRLIKSASARGVHMGTKSGRVAGDRLGYSQIINPIYLMSKKTMTFAQVANHILRNVASNLARSLNPEPFIDRRGRLRGNFLGFLDLMKGRLEPERAAQIAKPAPTSRTVRL